MFKGFKYNEWRNLSDYDGKQLPETGVDFYMSKIGVEPYLKNAQCDTSALPYIPTTIDGWTSGNNYIKNIYF